MAKASVTQVTHQVAGVSTAMTGAFLASGSPFYSDAIDVRNSDGFASIIIDVNATGTEDVDYEYEISMDGTNWYLPYDTGASSVSVIKATAVVASVGIYAVDIQLACFIRFKLVIATDSTIDAFLFMQKESSR